ncbi:MULTISPECIES: hypothetical protein [Aerococcus]|uniref:hypothetical protein n=1 Tax=Aerococcus TaxID=1375 RepID=UPI000DCD4774|nr:MULTISPECIES: hypothetical protein [Aerococcus]KAA9299811.1 hypothetical protein F6I08_00115 [Aerococcus tenax]MDK8133223.1 hypothetical protein [Aerococcus urinae]MDK8485368.1 hypothetical protein [Aerococcus urinae]MDL5178305.1 hypothetical protein [Aerococcus tenax]MDL5207320.1 hypothetical protein [Aerococcus tenax]
MTTNLNKFDEQFKEISKRNDERINQLNIQLSALLSKKEKTETELVKAESLENVEESIKKTIQLNEELEVTKRAIKYLQDKIANIKTEPLITKAEYKEILNQIESLADSENQSLINKLRKPLNEIKKISDQSLEVCDKADNLINIVYKDLVKKDPRQDHSDKFFKDENGATNIPATEYKPSFTASYFYNKIKDGAIEKGLIEEA